MAKSDPQKLKAGLDYLDDIIRTAYGTHDRTVANYTKYTSAEAVKHARQKFSKLGIQQGAKEGGKRVVSIITEAKEGYIRDRVTGNPTRVSGTYINIDDVKAAMQAQIDEAMSFAKSQKKIGLEMGEQIGRIAGAQVTKTAIADATPGLLKQGAKMGFRAGAKMFGPVGIVGGIAIEKLGKMGMERARQNAEFRPGNYQNLYKQNYEKLNPGTIYAGVPKGKDKNR